MERYSGLSKESLYLDEPKLILALRKAWYKLGADILQKYRFTNEIFSELVSKVRQEIMDSLDAYADQRVYDSFVVLSLVGKMQLLEKAIPDEVIMRNFEKIKALA